MSMENGCAGRQMGMGNSHRRRKVVMREGGRVLHKKFREMIIYTCLRSENDPGFGAVKLNKLLFFMDLAAYKRSGKTISGQEYKKLPLGPVPTQIPEAMKIMEEEGEICTRKQPAWNYVQHRTFALREADLKLFSRDEMMIMESVIARYMGMTGTDISLLSHEFLGWQLADVGEAIPLGVIFISRRGLTKEEKQYAEDLVNSPASTPDHA